MKKGIMTKVLSMLVLLTAVLPSQAQDADLASCLMRIRCQEDIFPVQAELLETLLNSTYIKVQGDELMLPPVSVKSVAANATGSIFRVTILEHTYKEELATEMFTAMTKRLKEALLNEFEQETSILLDQINRMEDERSDAHGKLQQLQNLSKKLSDKAGVSELSRRDILKQASLLEKEVQQLDEEQVVTKATKEAIQKELKIRAAVNAERAEPIQQELREILQLREQMLEAISKGYGPSEKWNVEARAEVNKAREDLARARIELIEQTESLSGTGEEFMVAMNTQLSELAIESAQFEAKWQYLTHQIRRTKDVLELADSYELDVRFNLGMAEKSYQRTIQNVHELKYKMSQMTKPSVSLVGRK